MPDEPARLTHEAAIEAVRCLSEASLDTGPGLRPFVLVEGGRGCGKSSFVRQLAEEAGEFIPCARIDFAAAPAADVAVVLSELAGQLVRYRPQYGRLRFPRLLTGQFVANWENLDPARFDRLGQTIKKQLREYRASPAHRESREQPPEQPSPEVTVSVAGEVTLPLALLTQLVRDVRPIGEGVRWYGDQDRGLRQRPEDVLAGLYRSARISRTGAPQERERARDEVNALLCAAFLADLRHTPRRVRHRLRTPLLLFDNVHAPAGRALLRELVDARHRLAQQRDRVPVTVVLTCLPDMLPELEQDRRGPLAQVLGAGDGGSAGPPHTAHGTGAPAWGVDGAPPLLCNSPPELTREEIEVLHRGQDGRGDWRLVRLVHEFSGGHQETGRLLCEIASARGGTAPSVAEMLADRVPHPPKERPDLLAERLLLERLLPFGGDEFDSSVKALVPLAAARTREERHWVAARTEFAEGEWQDTLLAAAGWDFERDAGLRVLRQLLLNQLAARAGDDPAGWAAVHEELARRGREHRDLVGRLHHQLALERLDPVVRELAAELGRTAGDAWLELVYAVAQAPCGREPRRRMAPYHRYESMLGELEEDWWERSTDPAAVHTAKLVAAWRVVSDPLTGMERGYLYGQMASALTALAELAPRDGMVPLNNAAHGCHREAAAWARP